MRTLRIALGAAIIAALLAGLGLAIAQAPNCTGKQCVDLPLMQAAGIAAPTATPVLWPIPAPLAPCAVHEPAPMEGGQAWLTAYNLAPGETSTLCMRLIVGGQVARAPDARAFAILRYSDQDRTIDAKAIRVDGVAVIPLPVAAVAPGQIVVVDVVAISAGQSYPAQTMFLIHPVPTATIRPTPMPTITRTPTRTPIPTP